MNLSKYSLCLNLKMIVSTFFCVVFPNQFPEDYKTSTEEMEFLYKSCCIDTESMISFDDCNHPFTIRTIFVNSFFLLLLFETLPGASDVLIWDLQTIGCNQTT